MALVHHHPQQCDPSLQCLDTYVLVIVPEESEIQICVFYAFEMFKDWYS